MFKPMAITSSQRAKLVDAINTAFADIGTKYPSTMLPPGGDNHVDPILHEVFVSRNLATIAEARKVVAFNAGIAEGLYESADDDPQPPGTDKDVAHGKHLCMHLKVNKRNPKIEWEKVIRDLRKAGVKKEVIDPIIKKHTIAQRGQHIFSPEFITFIDD